MFMHIPVLTVVDTIATIEDDGTDVNTTAVASGSYVEFYGIVVSTGLATTTTQPLQVRVDLGATQILEFQIIGNLLVSAIHSFMCPPGTFIQGSDGGNIVVDIENLAAANLVSDVSTTVFYRLITPQTLA